MIAAIPSSALLGPLATAYVHGESDLMIAEVSLINFSELFLHVPVTF
jgi:hypothetical protein